MKLVKISIIAGVFTLGLLCLSCKKSDKSTTGKTGTKTDSTKLAGAPPLTWQEHWFEHDQLLSRVYYNNDLALYYDNDMDRAVVWPQKAMTDAWTYIKKNYGAFGDSTRLYVVMHADKYGGGHPADAFDPSHDYRNAIDVGLGKTDWLTEAGEPIRITIHEMGHIVASSSNGRRNDLQGSTIWGDSKFAEIFIYDVLMNIGQEKEAADVYQGLVNAPASDNTDYPGVTFPGVNFFVDWFYPIYSKYGKGAVLAKYFELISKNVPASRTDGLNLGEFVHFFSGAAGVNLGPQAKIAFKSFWNTDAGQQFKQAQIDFPNVKYN
jgi:hypothetical protein